MIATGKGRGGAGRGRDAGGGGGGGACSPKALVAQAESDLSPWLGQHSSEAETSDDHRAIEVERSPFTTPEAMPTPPDQDRSMIISSSAEPSEPISAVASPIDLVTQADPTSPDASPPLG